MLLWVIRRLFTCLLVVVLFFVWFGGFCLLYFGGCFVCFVVYDGLLYIGLLFLDILLVW